MAQDRFQPIDPEGLNEKADTLNGKLDDFALLADPRQDKTPYQDLMMMKRLSDADGYDLDGHRYALRKMAIRLGRMLPVVRRMQGAEK